MHSTWRNQSDVMDDIWALSEMEGMGNHEIEEPPPPTILEYRAQMAANNTGSIYDAPEVGPENITYKIPGVGRGRFGPILHPGIPGHSDHMMTEEVKRKIRQVTGVGYSNALIEQGVKAMTMARNGDSTATSTSQKTSPTKTASHKPSGLNSPNARSISSASLTSTSPHSDAVEEAGPPPPLSVMRKKAEEERLKSKQNGSAEVTIKRPETPPRKDSPRSVRNGKRSPWQSTSSSSSSDEGSWRRRDGNMPNRFFKPRVNGFSLNCDEFPALK